MALSAIPPGYEQRFTPALCTKVVLSLRVAAAVLSTVALALILFAGALARTLALALANLFTLAAALRKAARSLRYDRLHLTTFFVLLIWASVVRLTFFGEPIRHDEAYTFTHYASRPIFVVLSYYTANNHLLSTLLMHVSTALFGASVWSVRLPTMIAGILLVPASYTMARLYYGKNAALLCMALVSGSSPLIEYSFNARGYCLATLFFLTLVVLIGLIQRGYRGAWIFVPVSASLCLYAIPVMLYAVGGVFLYLLLARGNLRSTLLAMIMTGVLTAALYAPVIGTVGLAAITSNKWTAPVARSHLLSQSTREFAALWAYWRLDYPRWLWFPTLAVTVIALFTPRIRRLPPAKILLCVTIVAAGFVAAQCLVPPRRTWLFLLPLCFAIAAAGSDALLRRATRRDAAAVAAALTFAIGMGYTVLHVRSLRHSGIESVGARSAEAVVLGVTDRLSHGGQFICPGGYFDAALDFYLFVHRVPYSPSPQGELLILTSYGRTPEETLALAGIPSGGVLSIHKIASFQEAAVYSGERGPGLPFLPMGSPEMGAFTAVVQ